MRSEIMRKDDGMHRKNITHILSDLRLALGGAITGAALLGIFLRLFFGVPENDLTVDLIGALLGFVVVAGVKLTHII
jgi:uncharacterized membrane protein